MNCVSHGRLYDWIRIVPDPRWFETKIDFKSFQGMSLFQIPFFRFYKATADLEEVSVVVYILFFQANPKIDSLTCPAIARSQINSNQTINCFCLFVCLFVCFFSGRTLGCWRKTSQAKGENQQPWLHCLLRGLEWIAVISATSPFSSRIFSIRGGHQSREVNQFDSFQRAAKFNLRTTKLVVFAAKTHGRGIWPSPRTFYEQISFHGKDLRKVKMIKQN